MNSSSPPPPVISCLLLFSPFNQSTHLPVFGSFHRVTLTASVQCLRCLSVFLQDAGVILVLAEKEPFVFQIHLYC